MKKFILTTLLIGLLAGGNLAFADGSCLNDPTTRRNYYNGRRMGDNLTNHNNRQRYNNSYNNGAPEWVLRQENQNTRLHEYKRQHSDFTEDHWDSNN